MENGSFRGGTCVKLARGKGRGTSAGGIRASLTLARNKSTGRLGSPLTSHKGRKNLNLEKKEGNSPAAISTQRVEKIVPEGSSAEKFKCLGGRHGLRIGPVTVEARRGPTSRSASSTKSKIFPKDSSQKERKARKVMIDVTTSGYRS